MHHAYLLLGGIKEAQEFIEEKFGKLQASPDYFFYELEVFGVDNARQINESAIRKAFGQRKIFLIAPQKITLEAQNALLKTFEEPVANTHFFLCLPDAGVIIPTLLSRMQAVYLEGEKETNEAEKFLKLSLKDRLVFVRKFVDAERSLSPFLDLLLSYMRSKKVSADSLKQVYKMRLRSDERGSSARLILEHLSLVI